VFVRGPSPCTNMRTTTLALFVFRSLACTCNAQTSVRAALICRSQWLLNTQNNQHRPDGLERHCTLTPSVRSCLLHETKENKPNDGNVEKQSPPTTPKRQCVNVSASAGHLLCLLLTSVRSCGRWAQAYGIQLKDTFVVWLVRAQRPWGLQRWKRHSRVLVSANSYQPVTSDSSPVPSTINVAHNPKQVSFVMYIWLIVGMHAFPSQYSNRFE
jgi:hypothetical protein